MSDRFWGRFFLAFVFSVFATLVFFGSLEVVEKRNENLKLREQRQDLRDRCLSGDDHACTAYQAVFGE